VANIRDSRKSDGDNEQRGREREGIKERTRESNMDINK
jgi:hypothetical protein